MQTYEITQKILSIGTTYEVRPAGSGEVLHTVKGKILSATPKLTMIQGVDGPEAATIKGNLFKTNFRITGKDAAELGVLAFPLLMLKKTFTLSAGGNSYKATGGFTGWSFSCKDAAGAEVFAFNKKIGFKDRFEVAVSDGFPKDVAVLAAVAIDQKFFQEK